MQNNWIPPIITIMHTIDGQPEVGSPKIKVFIIIKIIKKNATIHIKIPKKDASANGAVEKPIIPSQE